jgi:hypothetical protein
MVLLSRSSRFLLEKSSPAFTKWMLGSTCILWIFWQLWGVEIIRPPWEDEILYTLPAVNWIQKGIFAIPQLGDFMGASKTWGWHAPGFPLGLAAWLWVMPLELWSIRLYAILPATILLALLAFAASKLAGSSRLALLLSLGIFFFDKTFVIQSTTGRMEFHAAFFLTVSVFLLFWGSNGFFSKQTEISTAGFLFGLSACFHPITVFFSPALVYALWHRDSTKLLVFFRNGIRFSVFCLIPVGSAALWLTWMGQDAMNQFFSSASGSGSSETKGNLETVFEMVVYNFRFQPMLLFGVLTIVIGAFIVLKNSIHWENKSACILKFSFNGFLVLIFCFLIAIIRGSTSNLNYYIFLNIWFLMLFATSVGLIIKFTPSKITIGLTILFSFLIFLNNLAFAGAKTYTVWVNDSAATEKKLLVFMLENGVLDSKKVILPPNLWFLAAKQNLNWRVSYLTLIGQSNFTYQDYLQENLAWQADYIILDEEDWPARSYTFEVLSNKKFIKTNSLNETFKHRPKYSGWRLSLHRNSDFVLP